MTWTTQHTEHSDADRGGIWALWSDVSTWPEWDAGVQDVRIDGPFASGTTGRLKPASGPAAKFTMVEAEPGEGFTDETRLPLARMRFEHSLADADDGGTLVTHRVTIDGPLAPLWSRVIGRGIERDLPHAVQEVARRAATSA